jgi:GntP family gluconate:H+ symporter
MVAATLMESFVCIATVSNGWPFLILAVCVFTIVVLITKMRVHPFIALIGVAILAGVLTPIGTLPGEPEKSHWVQAVEVTSAELGFTCGRVAIVIALASIIGVCIMESGAADKVVRRFIAIFGEKRAGLALLVSGFLLGLPIFFDTLFMLLIPLARALRVRLGKDYTLLVLAICCAGAVTHSLVAPHPGPLAMAEALRVDLGWSVIVGTLVSIPPVIFGWQLTKWLNRRNDIPLRETSGVSLAELEKITDKPEAELPSFFASILPVFLPIFLISLASFLAAFGFKQSLGTTYTVLEFLGNRNVALLIGALLSMMLVVRYGRIKIGDLGTVLGPALETAGVIILITAAGGAFGLMLKHAGVGDAIRLYAAGREINLILLAWAVALLMKFAQGSATVSMLTTAAMMVGIMQGTELPFHPMYIFLAIGFGALGFSWMNDSGFWVIGRLSGFTTRETLRTWTVLALGMSCFGLIETLLLATFLPFKP